MLSACSLPYYIRTLIIDPQFKLNIPMKESFLKRNLGPILFIVLMLNLSIFIILGESHFPIANKLNEKVLMPGLDTAKKTLKPRAFDRKYNDIARFIAGLPQDTGKSTIDSAFRNDKNWKNFSETFSKNWSELDTAKLSKRRKFSRTELNEVNTNLKTLFYPFSGPDILNAYTFFPYAHRYIMIGLEPVGTVPNLKALEKDSLKKFVQSLYKSLDAQLTLSFFKTKNMAVDLRTKEIDGTLPILYIFLARTNNVITDTKPVHIDKAGKMVYDQAFHGRGRDTLKTQGVEISFFQKGDTTQRKVYFFSSDISNGGLTDKSKEFQKFITGLSSDSVTTYVKSASYLMHKEYFTAIRSDILAISKHIVQDDSGIPLGFFDENTWDLQLYGVFTVPIPLFKGYTQPELVKAYKEKKTKPLDFGIGYQYLEGRSNMLLAHRKPKAKI